MIAGCPGLLYMMHGHWFPCCYSTCTFLVDVATCFIFPHFQESTNAHKTLTGKQGYEQFCQCYQHNQYLCVISAYQPCQLSGLLSTYQQHVQHWSFEMLNMLS